jgi:hypothetical protein
MSFLKRRRVKRKVTTASGKTCNRGYCYIYQISNQGYKYLKYLGEPKRQPPPSNDDLAKLVILQDYKNDPVKKEQALALYDTLYPPNPLSEKAKFWQQGKNRPQAMAEGKRMIEELQRPFLELDRRAELLRELAKYLPSPKTANA